MHNIYRYERETFTHNLPPSYYVCRRKGISGLLVGAEHPLTIVAEEECRVATLSGVKVQRMAHSDTTGLAILKVKSPCTARAGTARTQHLRHIHMRVVCVSCQRVGGHIKPLSFFALVLWSFVLAHTTLCTVVYLYEYIPRDFDPLCSIPSGHLLTLSYNTCRH